MLDLEYMWPRGMAAYVVEKEVLARALLYPTYFSNRLRAAVSYSKHSTPHTAESDPNADPGEYEFHNIGVGLVGLGFAGRRQKPSRVAGLCPRRKTYIAAVVGNLAEEYRGRCYMCREE